MMFALWLAVTFADRGARASLEREPHDPLAAVLA